MQVSYNKQSAPKLSLALSSNMSHKGAISRSLKQALIKSSLRVIRRLFSSCAYHKASISDIARVHYKLNNRNPKIACSAFRISKQNKSANCVVALKRTRPKD